MRALLKKYLLIYISVVAGVIIVIAVSFTVGDIANRMKPGDQILFEIPPAYSNDSEPILIIYAWENVWNNDMTSQSIKLTTMQKGEAMRVGRPLMLVEEDDSCTKYTSVYQNMYHITSAVVDRNQLAYFIAEADGNIAAECTDFFTSGNARLLSGVPENDYLTFPEVDVVENPHNNYIMALGIDARWHRNKFNNDSEAEEFKEMHTLRDCADYCHMSEMSESLYDVYKHIPKNTKYMGIYRNVYKSAILISVYDQTYPDKLLAQAEIRFVSYTHWIDKDTGKYVKPSIFNELQINTPDSYGYTEAVLYDYWQIAEQ